jgi:hypothetical protein
MSALNYCDVAFVRGGDLARAVSIVVAEGHGSVFLLGGDDRVRELVFAKLAARGFGGDAHAIAIRLWALVGVLQHRRLHQLLLEQGHVVLAIMAKVASRQRLNVGRGLNPQTLLLAVMDELARACGPKGPQHMALAA